MQSWQKATLVASIFIGAHYLLLRAASGRIGDALGALVLESAAAVGIALAFAVGVRGHEATTTLGVVFSVLSGFGISGASILLFYALRNGGPVASTGVLVLGGGVILSALLAPFVFSETWTVRRALGIALGLAAMFVLSTEDTSR